MRYPGPIQSLIDELRRLPGIGERSAQRLAFHLLRQKRVDVLRLATALQEITDRVRECGICCDLTDIDPCRTCTDDRRDGSILCVVEEPQDLRAVERTGEYRGLYHVLHGALSPVRGIGPEDLRIHQLEERLQPERIREVIIALPSDVEGDATSHYLAKLLAGRGVTATRIAHGLPVGAGLEFADGLTLGRAIEGRRPIE